MRQILLAIPRAFGLVWCAGPGLTFAIILLTLVAAYFPLLTLWLTKLTLDRIVLVFEKGELVEEGSHETLLSRNGLYASLFETQAERYR